MHNHTKYLLNFLLIFQLGCATIQIPKYIKPKNSDWLMYGGNPQRTNFSNSEISPPFKKLWEFDVDAGFSKYSAVVADSYLFVPTLYGELYVINIYEGKKYKKQKFNSPISGSIVLQINEIILPFFNRNNSLINFELTSGKNKWKLDLDEIDNAPCVYNNTIFVSNTKAQLYSIDKNKGIINWSFGPQIKRKITSHSSPATDGKVVVYGCENGILYCLDFDNGRLLWQFETKGNIMSSPSLDETAVYFGSVDGNFYSLDLTNGNLLWEKKMNVPIYSSQAISDSFVYVAASDGIIRCYEKKSGEEVWSFNAKSLLSYSPIVTKNFVLIGTYNKILYALDTRTGNLIWSYNLNGRIKSSPIIWNNFLFVFSDDRYIHAFRGLE